eukprot:5404724-Karenia_brevis.AAC.1
MVRTRANMLAIQVAWTILQKSTARALDYDARLCPSWALNVAIARHRSAVCSVVEAMLSIPVSQAMWEQLSLPGALAGCGLRDYCTSNVNAAYWSTWIAHRSDVRSVAERL